MSDPKVGDTFTKSVTFTVTNVDATNRLVTVQDQDSGRTRTVGLANLLTNFQKVVAPPVTFNVGETVRDLVSGKLYSIGINGYYDHKAGQWISAPGAVFTDASYERVTIQ